MADIVEFPSNEGYTYFAKACIDSLCEGEENEGDIKIQVESISMGTFFPVLSATFDPEHQVLTLQIK